MVNVQLQENEMDEMGLAKHRKMDQNIPDQDVALDRWNPVLERRTPAV